MNKKRDGRHGGAERRDEATGVAAPLLAPAEHDAK